jgi:hypothetical protein
MLLDFQVLQRDRWEKMRTLQLFLRQHSIPAKLSQEIQSQVSARMNAEKMIARKDVEVLNMLSTRFRDTLSTELHGPILMTNVFLRICDQLDDALIQDLATHCVEWLALQAGQQLFKPEEQMLRAINIASGTLAYTPKERMLSEVVIAQGDAMLRAGSVALDGHAIDLAPGTWLCELALWSQWDTLGEAEVLAPSELLTLNRNDMVQVMNFHPEVARVMQDYSMTLCKIVHLAQPKLSDISEEMDLSEDGIICALPQQSRFKVSKPALQAVYSAAGSDEERVAAAEELEAEVGSGKCWLGRDPESGQVMRMVQLVILRLTRADGQICAKIGEWRGQDHQILKRRAQLPGGKMRSGEMPHQTLQRLLQSEFPGVQITIRGKVAEKTEKATSDSCHMITKYVTTEYAAVVDRGHDIKYVGMLSPQDAPQPPLLSKISQRTAPVSKLRPAHVKNAEVTESPEETRMEPLPIYINGDSAAAKASVYAWLSPDSFKALQDARRQDGDGAVVQADFSMSTWGKNLLHSTNEQENKCEPQERQQDTI